MPGVEVMVMVVRQEGKQEVGQQHEESSVVKDGDEVEEQRGKQGRQQEGEGEGDDEAEAVGSCEVEMEERPGWWSEGDSGSTENCGEMREDDKEDEEEREEAKPLSW